MAAPLNNIFALNNNGGRPAHYETPEELWDKSVEYFLTTKKPNGKYQPAMDMLTFYVGFGSRTSWVDYAKRSEEFSNVISKIKMFVRGCYESQLYGFAWAGSQFALRNLGKEDWKDEITEHSDRTVKNVTIVEKTREE